MDDLTVNSGDTAARGMGLAPYGIYPISPLHAAQLICDLMTIDVHMPAVALVRALERRGPRVEFPSAGTNSRIDADDVSFYVHDNDRRLALHGSVITQLLLEFVTLDSLADCITEVLVLPDPPAEPVPVPSNERETWASARPR